MLGSYLGSFRTLRFSTDQRSGTAIKQPLCQALIHLSAAVRRLPLGVVLADPAGQALMRTYQVMIIALFPYRVRHLLPWQNDNLYMRVAKLHVLVVDNPLVKSHCLWLYICEGLVYVPVHGLGLFERAWGRLRTRDAMYRIVITGASQYDQPNNSYAAHGRRDHLRVYQALVSSVIGVSTHVWWHRSPAHFAATPLFFCNPCSSPGGPLPNRILV